MQPLSAQTPQTDDWLRRRYPFLRMEQHFIRQPAALAPFFAKLDSLKAGSRQKINVVHIGDSHIQPDFVGQVVRNGLQHRYGNGGRGLLFPYQLALSNSPDDFRASSPIRWSYNRLAHPEIELPVGISGYGIVANSNSDFSMRTWFRGSQAAANAFDQLQVFGAFEPSDRLWVLPANGDTVWAAGPKTMGQDVWFSLDKPAIDIQLGLAGASGQPRAFYGINYLNDSAGIVYHSLGVNGARVDHYLQAELFWEQLPELRADLIVISLGTNGAQTRSFDASGREEYLDSLVEKLQQAAPGAALLFTTAPESFLGRRPNVALRTLNQTLLSFCARNEWPCYDLFTVISGLGTRYRTRALQLLQRDRIHYSAEGYRLMGNLLFNALMASAMRVDQ